MALRGIERFLDSERNPWKYVWRCAVHGHQYEGATCRRCGLRVPHSDGSGAPK